MSHTVHNHFIAHLKAMEKELVTIDEEKLNSRLCK